MRSISTNLKAKRFFHTQNIIRTIMQLPHIVREAMWLDIQTSDNCAKLRQRDMQELRYLTNSHISITPHTVPLIISGPILNKAIKVIPANTIVTAKLISFQLLSSDPFSHCLFIHPKSLGYLSNREPLIRWKLLCHSFQTIL